MKMSRSNKNLDKPNKEATITIRIDEDLKNKFNKIMIKKHTTASDFLRQYIIEIIDKDEFFKLNIINTAIHINNDIPKVDSFIVEGLNPDIGFERRITTLEEKVKYLESIILKNKE